jgi:hypothetical protein
MMEKRDQERPRHRDILCHRILALEPAAGEKRCATKDHRTGLSIKRSRLLLQTRLRKAWQLQQAAHILLTLTRRGCQIGGEWSMGGLPEFLDGSALFLVGSLPSHLKNLCDGG